MRWHGHYGNKHTGRCAHHRLTKGLEIVKWFNIIILILWALNWNWNWNSVTLGYYCKWWCIYGSAGPKLMWPLGIGTHGWELQYYWYRYWFLAYTLLYCYPMVGDWVSIIDYICNKISTLISTWYRFIFTTYFWQVSSIWKSTISILPISLRLAKQAGISGTVFSPHAFAIELVCVNYG